MKELVYNQTADRITNGVAAGAVVSPFWLQYTSDIAATLLPIAGLLWLVVQIVGYYRKGKK